MRRPPCGAARGATRRGAVRLGALALAGALTGALAPVGASAQSDAAPKLYIVNQAGASIAVVDQASRSLDTTLDLRTLGFSANAKPHHVVVEDDGSHWYVSLIGDGRVLKFDRENRLLGQVEMSTPGLLTLDPAHDSLYVGRSMTAVNPPKALGVIARGPFTMVEEQEVLVPRPHALAADGEGRWVHTASLAENRIASVETASANVVLSRIDGAARSLVMFALSPDGRTMLASGELSNSLLLFDLSQPPPYAPAKEIRVDGKPWEVRFADDRTAYVTLLTANAIAEVDVVAGTVTRVIEGRFAQPYAMILSPDGKTAFVSNQNGGAPKQGMSGHEGHGAGHMGSPEGWLSIVDLPSGTVVGEIPLGPGPTGMGAAGVR